MTDITAFPTIENVVYSQGITVSMLTTGSSDADIKPGMVVAINATGVTDTVQAALGTAGERPVGVALTNADVSTAMKVTVMMSGIAYVANYDDSATGDAGDYLITNDNAVGGTVQSIGAPAATGKAESTTYPNVIGYLLDDMAASGEARCFIQPCVVTLGNSS